MMFPNWIKFDFDQRRLARGFTDTMGIIGLERRQHRHRALTVCFGRNSRSKEYVCINGLFYY